MGQPSSTDLLRVFLSYRHSDAWARDTLVNEAAIHAPWVAFDELPAILPGDTWRPEASRLIRDADLALLLIGPSTRESEPIEWEILRAKSFKKRVLGVLLPLADADDAARFRSSMQLLQWNPLKVLAAVRRIR